RSRVGPSCAGARGTAPAALRARQRIVRHWRPAPACAGRGERVGRREMRMTGRLWYAMLAALTIAGGAPSDAAAADAAQGRALYDTRCVGCHDRSVHGRTARAAQSFEQ